MENEQTNQEKTFITPDYPHQCIKCEINFHNKGYKFVINQQHHCWYEQHEQEVEQIRLCPECGTLLEDDLEKGDKYCPSCGLITQSNIEYVAGEKIDLPYGKI